MDIRPFQESNSNYIKASDLQGRAVQVRMRAVQIEMLGTDGDKEEKPVLYFEGKEKGLALNKTNSQSIADMYGYETDAWYGQLIEIYPTRTTFGGKVVDCIRVRVPQIQNGPPAQAQQAAPVPYVPPQGVPAAQTQRAMEASVASDEIPF